MRPRRGPFEPPRRPEPQARINDAIRVPRVRLIDGPTDLGIKTTDEARKYAYDKGLDLVEVAAQADPPVAKVMDYGKFRYEQEQKAKVKVTIMFRGREREHPDRGRDLLMRLAEDVKELGVIELQPLLEGRNMTMVLAPTKNAGVKRDAESEEKLGSEEEVQGDGVGEAPPSRGKSKPQPRAQVSEAEAGVQ